MSIYEAGNSQVNGGDLTQTEAHLYGSSRLGIFTLQRNVENPASGTGGIGIFERGGKFFELGNHLGNVLVTISDKKIGHDAGNGTVDYYTADVLSAQDYYPFGMMMPGRVHRRPGEGGYRYGFNGKENDNEVKGEGNQQDYGMRISDPRLGRFLSTDPLGKKFPFLSPYQYASNSPIAFVDLDGAKANYATFKMMAESIEAEAALYKNQNKEMPFRLKAQIFMLGMAKSASVEGLMYQIDKDLQATFSNVPSINFNELPPTIRRELQQQVIDQVSPFGMMALVKDLAPRLSHR